MPCDEWCRILERYRSAVNRYDEAVNDLGCLPGPVFNETWQRAEWARKQSDRCRADLLHHEHDHACLVAGPPESDLQMADINTEELVLGDQGQFGG
jgi:hypothetical protein